MAYAQDTIVSPNAANALATVLTGLLIDAGWTLVEALTPSGSNSPNTKVYKSAAGDNVAGYDWYLTVMYKGVGTEAQMRLIASSAYDAGTHLASCIAFTNGGLNTGYNWSAPVNGDMFGTYDVNQPTDTNVPVYSTRGGSPSSQPWFSTIIPSSAFGYWASVTLDHVSLFTTIADGVTPEQGPPCFIASTLDVDAAWAALNAEDFGNGVVTNPVVMFSRAPACSGSLIGDPSNSLSPRIQANTKYAKAAGSKLPTLVGNWLPAYAWRPAWYWSESGASGVTSPVWDSPQPGDGRLIGTGIDYYMVYGGDIGDTVEIDAAVYVLSGKFPFAEAYVAVLVE